MKRLYSIHTRSGSTNILKLFDILRLTYMNIYFVVGLIQYVRVCF